MFSASHGHLLLDIDGVRSGARCRARGRCVDTWRTCHDAFTAVMYADVLRAGIAGRAELHSLFSDLLPPPQPGSQRRRREGIGSFQMPCWSALPAAADEARGDGLHRTLHDCIRRCTSAPRATGRRVCLRRAGGVWTIGPQVLVGPAACTRLRFLYKGIGGDAFRSTVVTEIQIAYRRDRGPRTKAAQKCETLKPRLHKHQSAPRPRRRPTTHTLSSAA